jgi:hypothetical protein
VSKLQAGCGIFTHNQWAAAARKPPLTCVKTTPLLSRRRDLRRDMRGSTGLADLAKKRFDPFVIELSHGSQPTPRNIEALRREVQHRA